MCDSHPGLVAFSLTATCCWPILEGMKTTMQTEDDMRTAAKAFVAAGCKSAGIQIEGRSIDEGYALSLYLSDAKAGNMIVRTVEAIPTEDEAAATIASMVAEAKRRARAVRQGRSIQHDLDRS